jgi:type I restriction enzyme S subunit
MSFRGEEIKLRSQGTTIAGITKSELLKIKVNVPCFVEQQAIVAKIESLFSELDKGVEQLEIVQQQLKQYRQSVLKAAFEGKLTAAWRAEQQAAGTLPTADDLLTQIKTERDTRYQQQVTDWHQAVKDWEAAGSKGKKPKKPGKLKDFTQLTIEELANLPNLPKGWTYLRLGSVLAQISDGPFGSNLKTSDYVDSGVQVVRLENVGEQKFLAEKKSFVTEAKYQRLEKHTVTSGDIIFSSFLAEQVRVCVLPCFIDRAINKADCFCLRPQPFVSNYYLCRSFSIRGFYHWLTTQVHGATRPRVNTKQLRDAPVPLCSPPEQQEVMNEIESRFSVLDELEKAVELGLKQAESLRQSILKKAFEGRLLSEAELTAVRESPAYEPAVKLLERIHHERQNAEVAKPKRSPKRKKANV